MVQPQKIRLLIADDHELVRVGLKVLLQDTDVKIVGTVSTGAAAVKFALENEVDVVLMDVRMPEVDGLTALGRLKLDKPNLPVVMFSAFENPTYAARAVALGASGYLRKGCTRDELVTAIQTAATGESAWTREELRRVTGVVPLPHLSVDVEAPLKPRESEVLRQLAYGLTNNEIAQTLQMNCDTVKEHVRSILRKLGVTDRTQAAVWAVRKELV